MMNRILALWLPDWPIQRLVRERRELAGQALVLSERDARCNERIKICSAAAWRLGMRPGMPLAEAQSLSGDGEHTNSEHASARHASSGHASSGHASAGSPAACYFEPYQPDRDRETLQQLAEWCERFSPVVGLDAEQEPEGLLLDAGSVAHLFGSEAELRRQLHAAFSEQRLTPRIVIADSLAAAWGLVRWLPAEATGREATGREATGREATGREAAGRFDALPIELLRLPKRIVQQLQRLGIQRVETLRQMPRASLAARFGEILLRRLDQLSGATPEPIVAHRPRVPLVVTRDLEHATSHREAIAMICGELFQQLSRLLVEQGQGVLSLECQFTCQQHRPLVMVLGLYQPTVDPQHLEMLLQMQWEQRRLPAAVESIRIAAAATAPRGGRQAELFAGATQGNSAELALLLERLSNRMGRERVVRAQLQPEAQVELAYRWVPLTGQHVLEKSAAEDIPEPLGPLLRPLRLLDPPQPIDAIGVSGTRPPAVFHDRQHRYRVVKHFGPERIETGWWRGPSCRRDYYRVETDDGNRWWLFRDLGDQRWFLHGRFE